MKALDSKLNIIPIIAKADTITKQELHKFKVKVNKIALNFGLSIWWEVGSKMCSLNLKRIPGAE